MVFTFLFSFSSKNSFDKCLWIKSDSMIDKKSIEEALFFAYEYDFDTVFIQARSRGDAFYNSNIVIKNNLIEKDFDPLDYAIKLGHSLGLEVHAWVNVYILWSNSSPPISREHVYYLHPDWMEVNIHGKSDANININIPSKHVIVRSDELKIRQILFNLLTNACKNSENSQVNLVITQGTFKDHKSIVFKVKDFGIGIPQNKINTICRKKEDYMIS